MLPASLLYDSHLALKSVLTLHRSPLCLGTWKRLIYRSISPGRVNWKLFRGCCSRRRIPRRIHGCVNTTASVSSSSFQERIPAWSLTVSATKSFETDFSLSLSLSVPLFASLSISLSMSASVSECLCISVLPLSTSVLLSLPLYVSASVCHYLCLCLSLSLPMSSSAFICLCLCLCQPLPLSDSASLCLCL